MIVIKEKHCPEYRHNEHSFRKKRRSITFKQFPAYIVPTFNRVLNWYFVRGIIFSGI